MNTSSLDPSFIPVSTADGELRITQGKRPRNPSESLRVLRSLDLTGAYDLLRQAAREGLERGEADRAISTLSELELHISQHPDSESEPLTDLRAAIMQIITALYVSSGALDKGAATAAATTLNLLARRPRRKDTPFLEILALTLYDIAVLHSSAGEYKQAERELEKSIKILERLAKTNPARYAPAVVAALGAATKVYHNRVSQAELLAKYQAATSAYTQMVSEGITEATERLAQSLTDEGDTLARMGRHREAIQYYTRALKYLQRLEPEFTERQLRVSIALGESMLRISSMRDKAIHLLNTMLHKALKINQPAHHHHISEVLATIKSPGLDILGIWHKIFPK
ncbi:MAG: tetratricopeptide repeat protein [Muribaculaceae bacterium]|nr:tetratricopeptide repeat protein [Muribaculaceae bacterium]